MRPSYQTQAPITSASRTCISTARSSAAPSSSCLPAKISRCLDFRHQGTKPMNTESGSQLIWWDTFLDTMLQDTRAMRKPLSAAACKLAISTATAPCLESWPGWIAVPHASQASSTAGTLTLSMVSEACSTRSNPQACIWQSLRMHHTRSKAKCCGCDSCVRCLSFGGLPNTNSRQGAHLDATYAPVYIVFLSKSRVRVRAYRYWDHPVPPQPREMTK